MEELISTGLVEILFGVVGITIIGWSTYAIVRAFESRQWPSTTGEILNSVIVERWERDYQDREYSTKYEAVVQYKYTVMEKEYISKRLSFNSKIRTTFRSVAEKEALRYKPGMAVEVYYDPAMPNEAVLMPGADFRLYIMLALGILSCGMSFILYYFA